MESMAMILDVACRNASIVRYVKKLYKFYY